jgi:hypothetical protein
MRGCTPADIQATNRRSVSNPAHSSFSHPSLSQTRLHHLLGRITRRYTSTAANAGFNFANTK